MLRKRSRSVQKDQYKDHLMHDSASDSSFQSGNLEQKQKSSSFFSVPGLFVGLGIKGVSDYESAWSPTSPLDYKFLTNLRNPFSSPRACSDGPQKSWGCSKVGLGIVDSLDDEKKLPGGKVLGLSGSRNILFGSQLRISIPSYQSGPNCLIGCSLSAPKSLPGNFAISPQAQTNSPNLQAFGAEKNQLESKPIEKIQSCSLSFGSSVPTLTGLTYHNPNFRSVGFSSDKKPISGSPVIDGSPNITNSLVVKPSSLPISIGPGPGLVGPVHASEIELSEDYTCVISHGPNPRTTHIFGDCILECHTNELANHSRNEELGIGVQQLGKCSNASLLSESFVYPSDDFLSFCYFCKKKLEEGKDIYMYRGEKAFCSCGCRDQEILIEEEMEEPANNSPKATCSDEYIIFS